MQVEYLSPYDLQENVDNPRNINASKFNKLKNSIKDFPEMLKLRPIIVDDDMVVLGGNMRLKACKDLKLESIPVIKASNLTEEQKQEFIIKDNVGFGEWDWSLLNATWDTETLDEWGMDVIEHDWNDLDYIEDEVDMPGETIHNQVHIVIPDDMMPEKDNIRDRVEEFINENFNGCIVR